MNASERPKFDPQRARGAAGASLFASLESEPAAGAGGPETPPPGSAEAKAPRAVASKIVRPLTVTEVTERVAKVLLEHLPRKVRVVGEISNLSKRNHWYFSLKDEQAVLSCVAWAGKARAFRFAAENGMAVVATGSVQFYAAQGKCQLYVDKLEPVGAGALELQFQALCEELRQLHYFAPARKKQPPVFPRCLAVITSETGAALPDVLDTLKRRCPAVAVLLVDVRVQGTAAAAEIVQALKLIRENHEHYQIDAVILTRGGGAREDLQAFNERSVAEALFEFPLPTIAAIGHETDTTIAELVADVRCATPTQAAMLAAPDGAELRTQLEQVRRRLAGQLEYQLRLNTQRLKAAEVHLRQPEGWLRAGGERLAVLLEQVRHRVEQQVQRRRQRFAQVAVGLERVRPHRLAAARAERLLACRIRFEHALTDQLRRAEGQLTHRVENLTQVLSAARVRREDRLRRVEAVLKSVDPGRVLQRGYSITRDEKSGRIIRSIHAVEEGAILHSELVDGLVTSRVTETERRVGLPGQDCPEPNVAGGLPGHLFD